MLIYSIEGTTAYNVAQIKSQYLLPMSLICLFGTGHARYHEIGLLMLIETS